MLFNPIGPDGRHYLKILELIRESIGLAMSLTKKKCIICFGNARVIKKLSKTIIGESLYQRGILNDISNLGVVDYDLLKCDVCQLEFSMPMKEATGLFYKAVVESNSGYYPSLRWEWSEIATLLNKKIEEEARPALTLLDVGCGGGDFLEFINKNVRKIDAIGIDSTPHSIEICKRKNITAICCELGDFCDHNKSKVDVITLWHVLEHVSDPVGLIELAKKNLNDGGSLFLSVPLSPASFEALELDPLNLPPHHLTRWSMDSLSKLADISEMSFEVFLPKADSFVYRVLRSLVVISDKSFSEKRKACKFLNLLKILIKNPSSLFSTISKQWSWPEINKAPRPDLILVKLSHP